MNGNLDAVGCAYGRETRRLLEQQVKVCVENTARTDERLRYGSKRFGDLEDAIKTIRDKMETLQQRLTWLLAAYTIGGTMVGNLIFLLLQHYLGR